jgi:PAT family beta-lactamase induction signal transducer AmpG
MTNPLPVLIVLLVFAFLLSCLEIAADGYYIRVFGRRQQAEFVGIKAAAIRGGIILSIILFITWAGDLQETYQWEVRAAWAAAVVAAAFFLFILAFYDRFFLPRVADDVAVKDAEGFPLKNVLAEYFAQDRVWAIVGMLLIFRFGQGIFIYMAPAFYMDPSALGGFGMNAKDVGLLKTYTDIPPMIIGGILGGLIIMKYGIRILIYPFTLLMCLPNFAYVYLAVALPMEQFSLLGRDFYTGVFITSLIESLGYGIGFSGFFYYIHAIADGKHKTSMLAISSGIMGLGFYLPGALSGVIQSHTGYPTLFMISAVVGLGTIIILPFLPMPSFSEEEVSQPLSTEKRRVL